MKYYVKRKMKCDIFIEGILYSDTAGKKRLSGCSGYKNISFKY